MFKVIRLRRSYLLAALLVLLFTASVLIGLLKESEEDVPTSNEQRQKDTAAMTLDDADWNQPLKDMVDGKTYGDEGRGFFVEYRLERERARGRTVEWIREIIDNPNSSEEVLKKAQERLLLLDYNLNKEIELENLIRASGYDDAAVLVEENSVTVVVRAESLTPEEMTRISEMVSRGTGVAAQNIVVVAKK